MKTIPMVPACQYMVELQRLTALICEYIHPEMVILFGYYAGMSFRNVSGGYEMLILVNDLRPVSVRELTAYLKEREGLEKRQEKHIDLHIYTVDFVQRHASFSYFFYIIQQEGVLLYENKLFKLKKIHYKATRSYHFAVGFTGQCLALGKALMQDAQRHFDSGIPRLAAYYLYQAVLQFLRAGNGIHYGFFSKEKEDLITLYLKIRFCSEEIADLWNGDGTSFSEWRLFGRIQSFGYKARFSYPYSVSPDLLGRCMEMAYKIEWAIEHFCQERTQFLKGFI